MTDPIALEVLRHRIEALCEQGAAAIQRTAISPVVVESKDYSCTVLDAKGGLIAGGGKIRLHFFAATNCVRGTLAVHGDTIEPGDVFFVNDPHNGGGLHASDVFVLRPVFVNDRLAAWAANSAHMMDVGGMVPGSFAPEATDCYQEGLRCPPVRLLRRGVEQSDVWSILRNNVRLAQLVEMDLRALLAGCHVVHEELRDVVAEFGVDRFEAAVNELADRTEKELRRRIGQLECGTYRAESGSEWNDELFRIPCRLTVENEHLLFDFEGAAPQTDHFVNSKPHIVTSELGVDLAAYLAWDLPYNKGIFEAFEVRCPEGSILDSKPPAPVAAAHIDVANTAVETAIRTLMLAISASPKSEARRFLTGSTTASGSALHTWAGPGLGGDDDGWLMLDAGANGGAGSADRDGNDWGIYMVAKEQIVEFPDVEILESWYPLHVVYKRLCPGARGGAGRHRAGAPLEMAVELAGTSGLRGTTISNRERLPVVGSAGGLPGATTEFRMLRSDGRVEAIGAHQQDFGFLPGDRFVFRCGSGGGWGDPLDRPASAVEADLRLGRLDADVAADVYGVIPGDPAATEARRREILAQRLARAESPAKPLRWEDVPEGWLDERSAAPLHPGVEQRGGVAVSVRTGAPLAVSPDHWTDGCPVLLELFPMGKGVEARGYLDPGSGHLLFVDVVTGEKRRTFESSPERWTKWSTPTHVEIAR
ncbi:MAG TPA: hydantoinase B/oxoprolinase family protein [Myxococcota bacterium]|nr:hydantoinase B/oxoprolinase family protein [Myxococcota bacterium]